MSSPVGLMETVLVIRLPGGDQDQDFARELQELIVGSGAHYLLQAAQSGETFPSSHNAELTPVL